MTNHDTQRYLEVLARLRGSQAERYVTCIHDRARTNGQLNTYYPVRSPSALHIPGCLASTALKHLSLWTPQPQSALA